MLLSRLQVCTLWKRMQCQVGPMPDMPISLTRCGRLVAHTIPVPLGPVVHLALRRLGSFVISPLAVKLSHCQFCVSRVSFPRESRVAVHHTAVQHGRFTVVARAQSGFLRQLGLLIQFLEQPIKVVTISSDDEIVTMHNRVQISC